jgi:hypothetical protein
MGEPSHLLSMRAVRNERTVLTVLQPDSWQQFCEACDESRD